MKSPNLDMRVQHPRLGNLRELVIDIHRLFRHVSARRRRGLLMLTTLQVISAFSEVVSLGAVIPFLTALTNAGELMRDKRFSRILELANITTEVRLIFVLAILFAATVVAVNILRMLTLWVQARLAAATASDLVAKVYRRSLYQPYQFHTNVNSSALITPVVYDFNASMSTIQSTMMITTQGLVIISLVAALLAYNAGIAIGMGTVTIAAYVMISRITKRRLLANSNVIADRYVKMVATLQESYGGIRDVILGAKQEMFVSRFKSMDRPIRHAQTNNLFVQTVPRFLLESILVAALSLLAAVLAWMEGGVGGALPVLGALAVAANRLLPAVQQIFASLSSMRSAHISLRRTLLALDRPLDPISVADDASNIGMQQSVALRNIWFRYAEPVPGNEESGWVLEDVSIEIPVNSTIALVGTTGCGKSTIADILLGLLHPQRGQILLDGVPLDNAGLAAWRRSIANVPQNIYLSDATIKENIAFGEPVEKIDMARVREAARLARIADFIDDRPLKYEELVGERGVRLSGGQRQRLGIARALYRRASMIIFDEATSALDNATESAVMDALGELSHRTTTVLIAHRLSTIRAADLIFEISRGRVVACGSYDQLLESSPSFRALTQASQP